jgi:hypothetical protein
MIFSNPEDAMATKLPWVGTFNINNESKASDAEAYTKEQALFLMAKKIAWAKGVRPGVILGYLKNHPHSYDIKKTSGERNGN